MKINMSVIPRKIFFFILLIVVAGLSGYTQPKPFYKEDFSGGKIPEGWSMPKVGNWDPQWIVTNQPYPGSYKYQQQAPPIASRSRGYHLQFQAGYFSDEDVDAWLKKKEYPDGLIISAPINCSGKTSVILKFQETFRWWDYHPSDTAGLFVGISTDSMHWHQWDMRREIKENSDMLIPLKEELNITRWAAGQPKVFIRFYWKGIQAWYWMVDDIELVEAAKKDIGIVRLLSHSETGNQFKQKDTLKLLIRNNGSETITDNFTVTAKLDGNSLVNQLVNATTHPLKAEEEREVIFAGVNLASLPVHQLSFKLELPGDEISNNNSLSETISTAAAVLGNLTNWEKTDNGILLQSGVTRLKVLFYKEGIFRIWLSPDGQFTNPAANDIVINDKPEKVDLQIRSDAKNIYLITPVCMVKVQRNPLLFSLYNSKGKQLWAEKSPLSFGSRTVQQLIYHPDEYFYGGGMQNGYFSHKDSMILIEKGGGWNNGGRPNPVPFFMSSYGYGVLRNTFDAGVYDFSKYMMFSHNENRFDCYYFVGSSLKSVIEKYTDVTGRPFMPARWQLSMGDANCYNKKGTTPDVIKLVADEYINHDMPRGWILPNDGYGCGYTKLDSTVTELHKRGFYTGLWTENGVEKIATEVGVYGTRLCKLDVAWVGPGYKYALDGCKAAYEGIEKNSDGRGFVWSVMGWAGTHRYSVVWTGDQYSSWEYIRFHIPTVIGSGLSAQNCATGDIDAIFGGSAKTYVRDLQWKCFTPVLMTMSGWAKKDKQPWIWGEPYTSINRKYLKLKMRLTPYMYTLMHEANQTGVPAVRGLLLEFPKDSVTWGKLTQYEYLLGTSLLVAPVFKDEEKRDSIYLPEGKWVDYWDGKEYSGKQWLNGYNAPLEKLPLFVKTGSVIPMNPQMNFDGERPLDTLFLDIYPGEGPVQYRLYEDDGISREYKKGVNASTVIDLKGKEFIQINAVKGNYKGMLMQRNYTLYIHLGKRPDSVWVNGVKTNNCDYSSERHGILTVQCGRWPVHKKIVVQLKYKVRI